MPVFPKVILRKNLGRALRQGHPWIFRDALAQAPAMADGTVVAVLGEGTEPGPWLLGCKPGPSRCGSWTCNRYTTRGRWSAIACARPWQAGWRALTAPDQRLSLGSWRRGSSAGNPRRPVRPGGRGAFRRHGRQGVLSRSRWHAGRLLAPLALSQIVDRDQRSGQLGEIEVHENGIRFIVDLGRGQKGGLFLDQRENRQAVAAHAAGKSVLNLYGYTGGFSLYAAAAGATQTDTVDIARPALATARRNSSSTDCPLEHARFHAMDALVFSTKPLAERGNGIL